MITNFDAMLAKAKTVKGKTVVVAAAQSGTALEAAVMAKQEGLADSILTGDEKLIRQYLHEKFPEYADAFPIIDTGADLNAACKAAMIAVNEGKAHVVLKGKCDSGMVMKAALNKDYGVRISEVISDVLIFETPERLVLLTDGGVNLYPELKEKIAIVNNAVRVAHALEAPNPHVAMLCAVETVNLKMPCTLDAAQITMMNRRGQIKGCAVDGPMALDGAICPSSAKLKGLTSEVAGDADILVVPNIEAGNFLGKAMTYYCKWRVAHVVVGTKAPILIASRADVAEVKLHSMALGIICS